MKKRVPFVFVLWLDAAGGDDVTGPVHALTAGWLLAETDQHVLVASEIFEDGSSRDRTAIPKVLIESIIPARPKMPERFKDWRPSKES